ncbi:UNVERIFIED_CONTAM: hypothetical protein FKN15_024271 [Acipenser sinensis]
MHRAGLQQCADVRNQAGSGWIRPCLRLEKYSRANNLGVTLDHCLSYSQHISTLARTCRFFLSNIR